MIIKLSNYDNQYRVASLAKTEGVKNRLLEKGLTALYVQNDQALFLPEQTTIRLTDVEWQLLQASNEYDVFEISDTGHAYKCFDSAATDNPLLITNRCNSNCIMCPTAEAIRKGGRDYSATELIEIARHIPSDTPHITITGGEPFLIKSDLFELLQYLQTNLPDVSYLLLTNGRAFCSQAYVERLKQTAPPQIQLGIPLHGACAQTHDAITQAEGSFVQTCRGLKNLLAVGAKVELRVVVSRLNAAFLTEVAALIVRDFPSVYSVKIIGLEMTGNAAKNNSKVWLDYPTAFASARKGIDQLIAAGIDVGLYNFPLCAVDPRYWSLCEKSISPYKVRFAPACTECQVKDACGGMFSGTIRLAKEQIRPIGWRHD